MFDIIKPINQCNKTGLEKLTNSQSIGDLAVHQYSDCKNRNRFVLYKNLKPIASILFDSDKVCLFRATLPEYQNNGYNSNLWLYAAVRLGNIKHSQYLTEAGQKLAKI